MIEVNKKNKMNLVFFCKNLETSNFLASALNIAFSAPEKYPTVWCIFFPTYSCTLIKCLFE